MSETVYLVQGDTLPGFVVTLTDSDGSVVPLSGVTSVLMKIRPAGSTALTDTLTGTVTDAANGVASFALGTHTLDTAGLFEAEISVTYTSGRVWTVYEVLKLVVRGQF